MLERIKELYQKLYEQNYQLLEEKKNAIKQKEINNKKSIAKNRKFLPLSALIIFIFNFLIYSFNISNQIPPDDYKSEPVALFIMESIIPIICITTIVLVCSIYAIYRLVIIPRKTVPEDFSVDNSTINEEQYNNIFCENIFKPIIEDVIPDIKYYHSHGISQEIYESMGFPNLHESYDSSDNIRLNSNTNLIMSKVHSKFEEGGPRSGYWYTTLFCGIASLYTLTVNIPISITIRNKKSGNIKLENEILSYDEEFNQYYYLATDNPDLFNKYCTRKMLDYLVELAKKNIHLDINIFQNKICIRLHDNDFLDFNTKSELDMENIINSCNSIMAIIDTNKFIVEELKNSNIY